MRGIRAMPALVVGLLMVTAPASTHAGQLPGTNLGSANGISYYSDTNYAAADTSNGETALCADDSYDATSGGLRSGANSSEWHLRMSAWGEFGAIPFWFGAISNDSGAEKAFDVYVVCRQKVMRYPFHEVSKGPRSGESLTLKTACPRRAHVVGGDYNDNQSPILDDTQMFASHPYDGNDRRRKPDDGWKVTTFNSGGPRVDQPEVIAICARGTEPKYRSAATGVGGGPINPAIVPACLDGEAVMGGGVKMSGPVADSYMASTYPHDGGDGDMVPENDWTSVMHSDSGNHTLTGWAICKPV